MRRVSDLAQLVVSELITNAVTASKTPNGPLHIDGRAAAVRLVLQSDRQRLVVEVYDQAPGQPVIREASKDMEGGRGLLVVAQSARQWGWNRLVGQHGKVVWAELSNVGRTS